MQVWSSWYEAGSEVKDLSMLRSSKWEKRLKGTRRSRKATLRTTRPADSVPLYQTHILWLERYEMRRRRAQVGTFRSEHFDSDFAVNAG